VRTSTEYSRRLRSEGTDLGVVGGLKPGMCDCMPGGKVCRQKVQKIGATPTWYCRLADKDFIYGGDGFCQDANPSQTRKALSEL